MAHPRLIFPHTGAFERLGKGRHAPLTAADVLQLLPSQISEQRLARLKSVVANRCYSVVPVMEGLHDVGNMSAVCRSADGEFSEVYCSGCSRAWCRFAVAFDQAGGWMDGCGEYQYGILLQGVLSTHDHHIAMLATAIQTTITPIAAMGLGAVHCVVNGTKYKQSQRTTAGAEKWLDVKVWSDTRDCLNGFKEAGFQIVTTHLSADSIPIQVGQLFLCFDLTQSSGKSG